MPIFKKTDPTSPSNYRPISILPVLSKIFEKLFCDRLTNFLERYEILNTGQFGFRKYRSTIDAVTKLVETVVDGLERREHVLSIFLDLSKAFDCVHHEKLLHQLHAYGVRGLPHKWLSSYLSDRHQQVMIGNQFSEKIKISQGVPQGSILGPVLFLVYVNNLDESVQNGSVIQYADDTTLCFKGKSPRDLEIKSFIDLNSIIQHFSEINLESNSSKATFLNFALRQRRQVNQPAVMMDDVLLEETYSTKFLGMYLDEGLTWDDHINQICLKVSKGIYALRNLAQFVDLNVLRMAYFGLIYPHMAYGIRLWGGCAKYKFDRVFRLQKSSPNHGKIKLQRVVPRLIQGA